MAIDQDFLKSIGLDDEGLAAKLIEKSATDEQGLVSKRDELLDKLKSTKTQLSEFEGVDATKYREYVKRIEELDDKDLMDKGEFEKIREKMLAEFEKERGTFTAKEAGLLGQLEGLIVDSEVAKAINEVKGNAKLLMPLIKQRLNVVDNDGKLVVKVLEEDGKTAATDGKGEPLSILALVESMKADDNYAGAFDSSGLSGSGAKPSGSGSTDNDDTVIGAARMRRAREKK